MFTLADGRVVTDTEPGAEMAGSIGGPIAEPVDIESSKVARLLAPVGRQPGDVARRPG
nr:hypothetical protein GCM10017611_61670 [Rhodococcus wratislaviensis]